MDVTTFNPDVKPFSLLEYSNKFTGYTILTYIGKINFYWQSKGLMELVEAAKDIKEDFLLLFLSNGKGLKEFKLFLEEKGLADKSLFPNFLPPWRIPSVIKLSTCVVVPERDFPIQYHIPILPKEVMAVGKCLILGKEIAYEQYYGKLIDKENVLLVDPKDISSFRNLIEFIIRNPAAVEEIGRKAYNTSKTVLNFNEFVDFTLTQYKSLV